MNENDYALLDIAKPTGPKARPGIRNRHELQHRQTVTMPAKTRSKKNDSKASTPNTSKSSIATGSPSSPRPSRNAKDSSKTIENHEEIEFSEESSSQNDEYDELLTSAARESDHQSVDTSLNNSSSVRAEFKVQQPKQKQGSNCNSKLVWIAVVIAVIYYFLGSSKVEDIPDTFNLKDSIADLKRLFPSQNKTIWRNFASGIADVKNKTLSPATFLLLGIQDTTTKCLAEKVAEVARSALNGTGNVILTAEMLQNNKTKVYDLMRRQMKRSKAVAILDVLSIQPVAITAFHEICDQYESLVEEAVYLFTMRSETYNESINPFALAEQQLMNSFSESINEDTLKALIVRLTNGGVLAIKPEENIPCSG